MESLQVDNYSPPLIQVKEEIETVVTLSPVLQDCKNIDITESVEQIKGLFKEEPDAIRIFAGGTQKYVDDYGNISWCSPDYRGIDNNGLTTGAIYRVAAGYLALKVFPEAFGIIGSRYPYNNQPAPNFVMAQELSQMGVDSTRIVSDPDTLDTIAEAVRLIEMAESNQWTSIACITNGYHLPRLELIIKNLDWLTFPEERTEIFIQGLKRLTEGSLSVHVVSCEDILHVANTEIYRKHILSGLDSEQVDQRRSKEQEGVNMLLSNTYFRSRYSNVGKSIQEMHKEASL